MKRALYSAAAATAVVLVIRVLAPAPDGIPLHLIPQGMTVQDVAGIGHVFVLREGESVTALRSRTPEAAPVQWCPYEKLFWSPRTLAIYNRYGTIVRKPSSGGGAIATLRARIDSGLVLHIERGAPPRAPSAPVGAQLLAFYDRYLNQSNTPGTRELRWCPNPVG